MVRSLHAELEMEKKKNIDKKATEKVAALKVIRENEANKKKRMDDHETKKEAEARAVIEEMRNFDRKEKQRADEVAKRDDRIKKIMNNMGDVVVHRDKELQMKQEREYI